jgi:hypothetical protein
VTTGPDARRDVVLDGAVPAGKASGGSAASRGRASLAEIDVAFRLSPLERTVNPFRPTSETALPPDEATRIPAAAMAISTDPSVSVRRTRAPVVASRSSVDRAG